MGERSNIIYKKKRWLCNHNLVVATDNYSLFSIWFNLYLGRALSRWSKTSISYTSITRTIILYLFGLVAPKILSPKIPTSYPNNNSNNLMRCYKWILSLSRYIRTCTSLSTIYNYNFNDKTVSFLFSRMQYIFNGYYYYFCLLCLWSSVIFVGAETQKKICAKQTNSNSLSCARNEIVDLRIVASPPMKCIVCVCPYSMTMRIIPLAGRCYFWLCVFLWVRWANEIKFNLNIN